MTIPTPDATCEKNELKAAFPQGQVKYLEREANYGLIESGDGRDVYFHRRCVIGVDFIGLGIGDRVRFSETDGREGLRATTVFLAERQPVVEW